MFLTHYKKYDNKPLVWAAFILGAGYFVHPYGGGITQNPKHARLYGSISALRNSMREADIKDYEVVRFEVSLTRVLVEDEAGPKE